MTFEGKLIRNGEEALGRFGTEYTEGCKNNS
jgi:hypothetical protein